MTACRADRPAGRNKARRLMAAGLFAVLAVPAWAQPQPYDPETMERMDPPTTPAIGRIEVDALKAPNPLSVGTLDENSGGFPRSLWAGTPAPVVRSLLPLLPSSGQSPTLRALQRRLLLTAATAPEGAEAESRPTLVELRAERLMAIGDLDGLIALDKAAPGAASGPLLERLRLDGLLLSGDTQAACAEGQKLRGAGRADSELTKLSILCAYLAGNTLQGNLALDLMRERKDSDHAFIANAEVLAGLPPVPADKIELAAATPLHVAAFTAAKLPLPAKAMEGASGAVARAITMSAANPQDLRLAAAERAEESGALPVDSLRKLYLETVFAPDEMAAPLTKAAGPRGRALLFRAATDQPDPLLKARFAAKAVEAAAAKGQTAAAARVFEAILWGIKPEPVLAAEAPVLARAMYALGRPEAAEKWLDMAKADPTAAKAAEALWPLAAIAASGPGQPVQTVGLAAWRAGLQSLPPEQAARRTALVLGVLAGLGAKIPDAAWLDTLSLPPGGANPGLFAILQRAALDARLGGTVLAGLAAIGQTPLDRVDALTLSEVVSALSVVGLGDDARRLAVEALLANGV